MFLSIKCIGNGSKSQDNEYGIQKHQFGQYVGMNQFPVGKNDQSKEYVK